MQLTSPVDRLLAALQSGVTSLGAYLAAHVLLCLVPAFFLAGVLSSLVPREAVTRWLGRSAPKWVAYPVAAVGGSLIAVCSCTVLPLFASIQKKGAGLGPAVTFLFFAPAGNVLALATTGVVLGGEFALARVVLSAVFGIGIGLSMAALFPNDDDGPAVAVSAARFPRGAVALLAALVSLLLAGTLKLAPLDRELAVASVGAPALAGLDGALARLLPFDAARGEEGVSVHGLLLIALVCGWALAGWRGLTHVDEAITRATLVSLGFSLAVPLAAALRIRVAGEVLQLAVTGRTLAVAATLAAVLLAARRLERFDAQQWLWESWRFVRQIAPLLVVGVFLVGVARAFVRPEWVRAVAGENTVAANAAGVAFGIVMYFPTLVEVPVAKLLLSLGMHPGPLLAYLMADPELSLQSVLVISRLLGRARTAGWVGLVAVFSLAAGLLWGARFDGLGAAPLALAAALAVTVIVALVRVLAWLLNRRERVAGAHP